MILAFGSVGSGRGMTALAATDPPDPYDRPAPPRILIQPSACTPTVQTANRAGQTIRISSCGSSFVPSQEQSKTPDAVVPEVVVEDPNASFFQLTPEEEKSALEILARTGRAPTLAELGISPESARARSKPIPARTASLQTVATTRAASSARTGPKGVSGKASSTKAPAPTKSRKGRK